MYCLRVYFHGPQTNWAGRISETETIAIIEVPTLWLAKMRARLLMRDLNAGRCGYAITKGTHVAVAETAGAPLGT